MRFVRWGLVMVAVSGGVLVSARWTLLAQERAAKGQARAKADVAVAPNARLSVQDALIRPLDLPFQEATSLEEVRQYLGKALGAQVVLDRAALDRLELVPEDTIQIDLKGVRLKVGLTLLLDQVGLAYRVVPEDNLLILTDPEGSDDLNKRLLAELKSLHREVHDLQDTVDDLRDLVEEDLGVEPDTPRHTSPLVGLERKGKTSRRSPRPARLATRSGVGG
jgi:hypothetical protein